MQLHNIADTSFIVYYVETLIIYIFICSDDSRLNKKDWITNPEVEIILHSGSFYSIHKELLRLHDLMMYVRLCIRLKLLYDFYLFSGRCSRWMHSFLSICLTFSINAPTLSLTLSLTVLPTFLHLPGEWPLVEERSGEEKGLGRESAFIPSGNIFNRYWSALWNLKIKTQD